MTSEKLTRQALYQVAQGYSAMYNTELRLGLENDADLEERYRTTVNRLIQAQNELPSLRETPALAIQEPSNALPKAAVEADTKGSMDRLSVPARQN